MYRQIWVHPKHSPFQRNLFRNSEGHIRDFELQTVTFGVNCEPFLAIRVLSQIAKLFHPEGWLTPFVGSSKIFMQEIWLQDLGWDDNLITFVNHDVDQHCLGNI